MHIEVGCGNSKVVVLCMCKSHPDVHISKQTWPDDFQNLSGDEDHLPMLYEIVLFLMHRFVTDIFFPIL